MKCFALAAALLALCVSGACALKCYSCVSNAVAANIDCQMGAESVSLVECSPQMTYCLAMITESATIDGINATLRTCTDEQLYGNGLQVFDGFTIDYRTCQQDGCNAAPSIGAGLALVITAALWIVF